jgi:hypothetical protein
MISLLENHMFSTQALLVMVLILSSAVAVKAGVYYGVGMPNGEYVIDVPLP